MKNNNFSLNAWKINRDNCILSGNYINMEEWTSVTSLLPEDSKFIMANVKDHNYVYHEILCYKKELKKWYFITGGELPGDIVVTAWKDLPASFNRL